MPELMSCFLAIEAGTYPATLQPYLLYPCTNSKGRIRATRSDLSGSKIVSNHEPRVAKTYAHIKTINGKKWSFVECVRIYLVRPRKPGSQRYL
jgi:hypothetical protein